MSARLSRPALSWPRLPWLDAARGLAVVAMVVFHLVWDLGHFGYIERSIPWSTPVKLFGHGIAFSFLFIAGFSLALANRDHVKWPAFWRRFAIVAGAAALVSVGTYVVFPSAWVFFGILHVIAAASLAALLFLRAPWIVTFAAGALALAAPSAIASPLFDTNGLMWLGLGTHEPMTQDWRPFFPWAGALLIGVAAGRAFMAYSVEGNNLSGDSTSPSVARAMTFLGRHSLIIYLVHQPALFAIFTALTFVTPQIDETAEFIAACEKQCVEEGGKHETCRGACSCLEREAKRSDALARAADDAARETQMRELARRCVAP